MSSFGYLKNLPVDVIKIDGSSIRELEHDAMSRPIVNAITEIGHQRGRELVAEWVASARVVELLRQLGVDYGQGYALHRPESVLYQRDGSGGSMSMGGCCGRDRKGVGKGKRGSVSVARGVGRNR